MTSVGKGIHHQLWKACFAQSDEGHINFPLLCLGRHTSGRSPPWSRSVFSICTTCSGAAQVKEVQGVQLISRPCPSCAAELALVFNLHLRINTGWKRASGLRSAAPAWRRREVAGAGSRFAHVRCLFGFRSHYSTLAPLPASLLSPCLGLVEREKVYALAGRAHELKSRLEGKLQG